MWGELSLATERHEVEKVWEWRMEIYIRKEWEVPGTLGQKSQESSVKMGGLEPGTSGLLGPKRYQNDIKL